MYVGLLVQLSGLPKMSLEEVCKRVQKCLVKEFNSYFKNDVEVTVDESAGAD